MRRSRRVPGARSGPGGVRENWPRPPGRTLDGDPDPPIRYLRRRSSVHSSDRPTGRPAVLINYYSTELDFNALLLWCSFVTVNRGLRVSPRGRATPRAKEISYNNSLCIRRWYCMARMYDIALLLLFLLLLLRYEWCVYIRKRAKQKINNKNNNSVHKKTACTNTVAMRFFFFNGRIVYTGNIPVYTANGNV